MGRPAPGLTGIPIKLNGGTFRYNYDLSTLIIPMESEQLNALTHQLQDLHIRSNELRRYL